MSNYPGRFAQLSSCSQVGYSTPPVQYSYHYSPIYSYTNPCSKNNYYSSCGNCPNLSKTDAYSNQPFENFSIQGAIKGPRNNRFCGCGK